MVNNETTSHEVLPRGSYLQNFNESRWDPHRAMWGFLLTFARYEPQLCASIWDRLLGAQGLRTYGEDRMWSSIAEALFLTERSVEKVIHSIFLKLGLTWETAVHKRVKAVILYLAESS